ncbi:MAG: hypothetical protein LBC92_00500 [Rickettsiales bacterium]|jgi:ferredoxin-thioredoxin reductase catalytic subunit|nr:hypothetical protein [Rickettsiales bacterium]
MDDNELNKNKMKSVLSAIAEIRGVIPNENIDKIINAKINFFHKKGMSFLRCPCDANDIERSCISDKCMRDIEESGICHCNCYVKKS